MSAQQNQTDYSQFIAENFGANANYVETLLDRFRSDPSLVDESWRAYFAEMLGQTPAPPTPGASAASGNGSTATAAAPRADGQSATAATTATTATTTTPAAAAPPPTAAPPPP
ncbi:MAG TPA: hypothetical protein VGA87_05000, partial [Pyrinomonadaceae bacterium]